MILIDYLPVCKCISNWEKEFLCVSQSEQPLKTLRDATYVSLGENMLPKQCKVYTWNRLFFFRVLHTMATSKSSKTRDLFFSNH